MWYETKTISNPVEYFWQYATNRFEQKEYEVRAKFIETFKDKIERLFDYTYKIDYIYNIYGKKYNYIKV